MVRIHKIYTRSGDDGTTGLLGNVRVNKDSARVNAYGDVDELNAHLGLARTLSEESNLSEISTLLSGIQQRLFDIGAILAAPHGSSHPSLPQIGEPEWRTLETAIDDLVQDLPELKSFILPGGNILNGQLHVARTVCRRAERSVLTLHHTEPVSMDVLIYLNRLSDLLFAMARTASKKLGHGEYLWVPGSATTPTPR